ncbi:aminotransferase class I/II-fold pyridoxal phosphate-dependent enzyme [Pectinatus frisingensis]|uniref:aminotransferase class I/II-fold pyridoxal phosphate-dependent enzyme n=1 Tax=Pectinatus frisingensis TaxID=865 RepID=UPI0018C800AB|nr:aminotransferase class I/II-fold pyridoxal phosphate-dependent enzyme [Pectinatus frisingensis]
MTSSAVSKNSLCESDADLWGFNNFTDAAVNEGFFYDILTTTKPVGPTITYNDDEFINFASINILDLHQTKDVLEHFHAAADIYGLTTGGSRVTQGVCEAHKKMENHLCLLNGQERAISFASGLLANLGFINAMSCKFHFSETCEIDNSDAIFVLDRDCHWSLWKAASHLKFGQQLFSFKHNNPADLRKLLARLSVKHDKIIVVFESVYSADGSIAPMKELFDACEQYHALSYVDDANGFLIYGPQNRLFVNEFAQMKRATFKMVSFSKAVGMEGGAITGPEKYIHAFEVLSGTSLFTAAIQPPTASTIDYIMYKLTAQPEIMDTYLSRSLDLRQRLAERKLQLNEDPSYIISVLIGQDEKAVKVYEEFLEEKMIVPMFRYPAVRPDHALIRIMLNAHHTEEQINRFVDVLCRLQKKYGF